MTISLQNIPPVQTALKCIDQPEDLANGTEKALANGASPHEEQLKRERRAASQLLALAEKCRVN